MSGVAALTPKQAQTELLRASLLGDVGAGEAWNRWCALVGDPANALAADRGDARSLAPLLDRSLRAAGAEDVPDDLRIALRAAAARERERAAAMWAGVAAALTTLADAGVPFTLVGGVAIAAAAYPEPGLRHCHDVDLLTERGDLDKAVSALGERGGRTGGEDRGVLQVGHRLGAPVNLRDRLLTIYGPTLPRAAMLARRRTLAIAGVEAPALGPDDALLHTIARGLCDVPADRVRWAADAWLLVSNDAGIDWDRLRETAKEADLIVIAATGLGYVAESLGAPVPASAIAGLRAAAAGASVRARDVAVVAALRRRRWAGGWAVDALRPRSALALARWTPAYLRGRVSEAR